MDTLKVIVTVLAFFLISAYALYDLEVREQNRYTIKDKEYVEDCRRVQEARAKMGMDMEKYWDQNCKRVLKTVDIMSK
jgi:hypothetical protein